MAKFTDLPGELVEMIVLPHLKTHSVVEMWEHAQHRDTLKWKEKSWEALANLSATCRGLHHLLGHHVNKNIFLDCSYPRTMRLLRAASANPAAFRSTTMSHVYLGACYIDGYTQGNWDVLTREDLVFIQNSTRNAGLVPGFERIWCHRVGGTRRTTNHILRMGLLIQLILCHLVNLQSVVLPKPVLEVFFLTDPNKFKFELYRLRALHLSENYDTGGFLKLKAARLRILPPQIRHKITDLHLLRHSEGFELDILAFPMLTRLVIHRISHKRFYLMLDKALGGLKHLETFACGQSMWDSTTNANASAIVDMLAKNNSKTLTKLIFHAEWKCDEEDEEKSPLSFRALPNLTDLWLNADLLADALEDMVTCPDAGPQLQLLRRLHVPRNVQDSHDSEKIRWLEKTVAAGYFPCLREITLEPTFPCLWELGLEPTFPCLWELGLEPPGSELNTADVMGAGVAVYGMANPDPYQW